MQLTSILTRLSTPQKCLVGFFVFILLLGFWSSLLLVDHTTKMNPSVIVDHYQGNEHIEDPQVMKFKKSKLEILTIVHTHLLSLAIIFFLVGILIQTTQINKSLKHVLAIEPFISLIFTFGGIYFLWEGFNWMSVRGVGIRHRNDAHLHNRNFDNFY